MRLLFVFLLIALLNACAIPQSSGPMAYNKLPALKKSGQLKEGDGVLVMSCGRERNPCKECHPNWAGILPFVSYHVLLDSGAGEYKEIAFIPAEAGMGSKLGKENYGYIHMRELPAGQYLMLGANTRGHGMMIADGNLAFWLEDEDERTEIAYEFKIEPGKINYLGEFVTVDGDLKEGSVRLSDEQQRDLDYAYKKYPQLRQYDVKKIVVQEALEKIDVSE